MNRETLKGAGLGAVACVMLYGAAATAGSYLTYTLNGYNFDAVQVNEAGDMAPGYFQWRIPIWHYTNEYGMNIAVYLRDRVERTAGPGGMHSETTGRELDTLVGGELRVGWADLDERYTDCTGLDPADAPDYAALYAAGEGVEAGRHLTLSHDPCPAYVGEDGQLGGEMDQSDWDALFPDAATPDELLDQPTAVIHNPHVDAEGLPRSAALEVAGALKIRRIDRQIAPADGEAHDPDCEALGGCGMAYDLYVDFDGNLVLVAFDEEGNRLGTKTLARRSEFLGGGID